MLLTQIVQIFTFFETITEQVIAEKYVTFSKIILFIKIIYSKLNGFLNSVELLQIRFMLEELNRNFDAQFPVYENNDSLCQSTFLDPCYKKVRFQDESRFVMTSVDIQRRIVTNMNEHPGSTPTPVVVNTNEEEDALWKEFDGEVELLTGGGVRGVGSIIESDKYKNEPLINQTEGPLKYWIDRKNVYPGLFQFVINDFKFQQLAYCANEYFQKRVTL